jgi:protein-disulfide isomerase
MKNIIRAAFSAILLVFNLQISLAASEEELQAIKNELKALGERQKSIQGELREIRKLLTDHMPNTGQAPIKLDISNHPFKGDASAPLTLVEFSDYECPFCGKHFLETLPRLEREYVQKRRLKYVFRNFPLASIHKNSIKSAEAAACAGEQGMYWPMHDKLFTNQKALGAKDIIAYAETVGLAPTKFRECMDTRAQLARVEKDLVDGEKAGIKGTPTFFLARSKGDDALVTVLAIIRGAQPFARFKELIDKYSEEPM